MQTPGSIRFFPRGRRGMTLAETMVATGVFSILMLGLLMLYLMSAKIVAGNIGQLNVQRMARSAVDAIMHDLRRGSSAQIYPSFTQTAAATNIGAYFRVLCPTNSVVTTNEVWRHFYVGNIRLHPSGVTNATLYHYASGTSNQAPSAALGQPEVIMDGISDPHIVFQQVGGCFTLNFRVVDPNDRDGRQVIFLRSAIAFRNPGLY